MQKQNLNIQQISEQVHDAILQRLENKENKTVYIISKGGSGCHFLGGLISMLKGYSLIDETYFPIKILDYIKQEKYKDAKSMIEMVNFIHIGNLDEQIFDCPINLMHLRSDTHLAKIKKVDYNSKFIFLIRNPVRIAISRGLRKEGYKAAQSKYGESLDANEYLKLQCNNIRNHFRRLMAPQNAADALIIRYEELIANTEKVMIEVLEHIGIDKKEINIDSLLIEYNKNTKVSKNKNKDPPPKLTEDQIEIIREALSETCSKLNYEFPEDL